MAKQNKPKSYKLLFPVKGLHSGFAYGEQPPLTTPRLKNVRPFDVDEGRGRGGQRPGLVKAFSTQVGGNHPVIAMAQVVTTYIEPEA